MRRQRSRAMSSPIARGSLDAAGVVAGEYIRRRLVFGHGYERGLFPEPLAGRLPDALAYFCEIVDEVAGACSRGSCDGGRHCA